MKHFDILDGGLATELEKRGHNLNHHLWSARLLVEDADEILAVHRDYLEAGADIVTSASYQASVAGFKQLGLSSIQAEAKIESSVQIARKACESVTGKAKKVAASIGPYGAALADGSEYTGLYELSSKELSDFHRRRWELLVGQGPDLILCETIPNIAEAEVLCGLAEQTDIPVWISFSCRDENSISDGTEVQTVAKLIKTSAVKGLGVNCTAPRHITPILSEMRQVCESLPLMAYPNSGEVYQAATGEWTGVADEENFAILAREWVQLGVEILGGCCRTSPEYIRKLTAVRARTTTM